MKETLERMEDANERAEDEDMIARWVDKCDVKR